MPTSGVLTSATLSSGDTTLESTIAFSLMFKNGAGAVSTPGWADAASPYYILGALDLVSANRVVTGGGVLSFDDINQEVVLSNTASGMLPVPNGLWRKIGVTSGLLSGSRPEKLGWSQLSPTGLTGTTVYNYFCLSSSSSTVYLAATALNGMFYSNDTGDSFTASDNGLNHVTCAVRALNGQILTSAQSSNLVGISYDGGQFFDQVDLGFVVEKLLVTKYGYPVAQDYNFVAFGAGNTKVSTDLYATSWTAMTDHGVDVIKGVVCADGVYLVIGQASSFGASQVRVSTDLDTWFDATLPEEALTNVAYNSIVYSGGVIVMTNVAGQIFTYGGLLDANTVNNNGIAFSLAETVAGDTTNWQGWGGSAYVYSSTSSSGELYVEKTRYTIAGGMWGMPGTSVTLQKAQISFGVPSYPSQPEVFAYISDVAKDGDEVTFNLNTAENPVIAGWNISYDGAYSLQYQASPFGNQEPGVQGNLFTFTRDRLPATLGIDSANVSWGTATSSSIPLVFTFAEDVTGFAITDITLSESLSDATLDNFQGSGSSYTCDLTDVPYGSHQVSVSSGVCQDLIGNSSPASTVEFTFNYPEPDTTSPTISLSSTTVTEGSTITASTAVLQKSISEYIPAFMMGVPAEIFTVTGGSVLSIDGMGNITIGNMTPGLVSVSVAAGAFNDGAGNPNVESNDFSFTYSAGGGGGGGSSLPAGFVPANTVSSGGSLLVSISRSTLEGFTEVAADGYFESMANWKYIVVYFKCMTTGQRKVIAKRANADFAKNFSVVAAADSVFQLRKIILMGRNGSVLSVRRANIANASEGDITIL